MQYCEIFDQIKATLEDYDGTVQRFEEVDFRSGNEQLVQDVAKRIRNIMSIHHLVVEEQDPTNADKNDSNSSSNSNDDYDDDDGDGDELSLCSPKKQNELRKVFVFLLLNTNIEYEHDLGELNKNICHILRICPLLPRFLFVEVVLSCGLQANYYELLTYAPPWLTYQHFNDAAASLQYATDPYEVLTRIEHIVCAAMKAITLAGSISAKDGNNGDNGYDGGDGDSNADNSSDTKARARAALAMSCGDTKQLLDMELCSCIAKLMLHFEPSTGLPSKFERKTRALKRFKGYVLRHLLTMCLEGLKLLSTPLVALPPECAIYAMFSGAGTGQSKRKQLKSTAESLRQLHSDGRELLLKVIGNLLNTLQTCIMTVEIDAYIDWTEEDAVNVPHCTNLQEHVGALAFELLEQLAAVKPAPLKHIVCELLKPFAIKPVDFETRMEDSTLGELLHILDAAKLPKEQQVICMNMLFKRFSIIYGNDECLETIANCAHLLSVSHCIQIMHYMQIDLTRREMLYMENSKDSKDFDENLADREEYEGIMPEDYETLICILQRAFLALPAKDKLQILIAREQKLGSMIVRYGLNFQTPNYVQKSNIYWNSFVQRTFEPNQFLSLCFENSRDMWNRYFRAALDNDEMVGPYLIACNATRSFARSYQQASMLAALGCQNQIQNPNFSDLFFALYFHHYRGEERGSMLKHLLYKINRHLKAARYRVLYVLIKLLEQLSEHARKRHMKRFAFGMLTSHVILTVANVMNQARWNMHNFSLERAQLVSACCIYMESNVEQYARKVQPMARKLLMQKIIVCNFSRFTAYYMQGLSLPRTRNYAQFVMPRLNRDLNDLTNYAKLMLCCTEGEIYQVANDVHFRRHLFVIMSTISHIAAASYKEEVLENYAYLFDAFVVIIGRSLDTMECSATYYLALFDRICDLIMTPAQLHPRLLAACAALFEKFAMLSKGKKTVLRRLRELPGTIEKQTVMRQIIGIKSR